MKNTETNARPDRPARQPLLNMFRPSGAGIDHPSLYRRMTPADARRARRVAFEAALAVIG